MPCYSPENVNAQRGNGVFDGSIKALQLLNSLGYGIDPALPLHLVYNPNGAFLPGPQAELEADYKRELKEHFGIVFNKLYTITNLPIARFASYLKNNNKLADYMALLNDAFNPGTVNGLMCRNTINVSWQGEVFDCDFNQMLKMQWRDGGATKACISGTSIPLRWRTARSSPAITASAAPPAPARAAAARWFNAYCLTRRFGALLRHAISMARCNVATSTTSRRTDVLPLLPQAPFAGAKTIE